MKYHGLFLWGLWGLFLLSESVNASSHEELGLSDPKQDLYLARNNFNCPSQFGSFPDPKDCSQFYVCTFGKAYHRRCGRHQNFCSWRKKCLPIFIAICGHDKEQKQSTPSVTVTTPSDKDKFVCPNFSGTFPDPKDCSKYYSCFLYVSSSKTCPAKELFDAIRQKCRRAEEVHCGDRPKPGDATSTPTPVTETTTQSIATEAETTTQSIATETETTTQSIATETETTTQTLPTETETQTTIEITTPTVKDPFTETDTTTEEITTTEQPTGPPDHDCDENDEDCIITETGDPKKWFKCPRDVGSFPHPSSDKLFIFCMNWIPSAKKCGLHRVFSRERSTCVNIEDLL